MPARALVTLEDYLALDEPDGPHHELSEGELLVTPSTADSHNQICGYLRDHLRAWTIPLALGRVIWEVDFLLGPATVRRPDVAVVLAARWRPEYRDQVPIPLAPDLAFEVLSKHDRPGPTMDKVEQYLGAGTQAVWLFDPAKRETRRYANIKVEPPILSAVAGDALTEPQLSGFRLELAELFRSAL